MAYLESRLLIWIEGAVQICNGCALLAMLVHYELQLAPNWLLRKLIGSRTQRRSANERLA